MCADEAGRGNRSAKASLGNRLRYSFAALGLALVGAVYVQGHPDVQGTTELIQTSSSPVIPGEPTATTHSNDIPKCLEGDMMTGTRIPNGRGRTAQTSPAQGPTSFRRLRLTIRLIIRQT